MLGLKVGGIWDFGVLTLRLLPKLSEETDSSANPQLQQMFNLKLLAHQTGYSESLCFGQAVETSHRNQATMFVCSCVVRLLCLQSMCSECCPSDHEDGDSSL